MLRAIVLGLLFLAVSGLLAVPAEAQGRGRKVHRERSDVTVSSRYHYGGLPTIVFGSRRPYHRPPGWDRGRKVGWGNCALPPGLAKKAGCHRDGFLQRHPRRHRVPDISIVIRIP